MKKSIFVALGGLCLGTALLRGAGNVEVGGLQALYSWPEETSNLVQNGSIEQATSGNAADWQEGPRFRATTEAAHSGRRSMRVRDSNLAAYSPTASQDMGLGSGWYRLIGWMKGYQVRGPNGAGGRITMNLGTRRSSTEVIRGSTRWRQYAREFTVLPGETSGVSLVAYRKPKGTIYFDDIIVHRLKPATVEGFLLYPNYRGVIFDDRSGVIRMRVRARPGEAGVSLPEMKIRLSLHSETAEVAAAETVPASKSFIMTLDTSSLPLGAYTLRLRAFRTSGAALFEYPAHKVVRLPAAARAGLHNSVDPDNVLVLDGRRTFALGVYDTTGSSSDPAWYEPRISEIAEAPVNLYLNYWLAGTSITNLNALMTTLSRHGMSYIHTANGWYADNPYWPPSVSCGGQTAKALGPAGFTACMAAALGTNPALAGFYTADEQPVEKAARVFGQYSILRANDPGGITFIAQSRTADLPRWRDAADVIDAHSYPIYGIPEGELSPLETVGLATDAAQAAVEGSRPVWSVIQFFHFGVDGHFPTRDELRSMSYMAVTGGAKGLMYWSYGTLGLQSADPARREEFRQRLISVTREIRSLEPALLSPDDWTILSQAPAGVRALPKRVGAARYLIAVNPTPSSATVRFNLAGSVSQVTVLGEERRTTTIVPVGGAFDDSFEPYEAHVYRW